MSRKKKENAAQSTRQLMGIDGIKDYCIATRMGDLVFFIIKPTNISVLSNSSISARIYALLNVVKGQAEIEMLALNSKESFEQNKNFYQERMGSEELPAIRRLLEQDSKHLDRIQVLMASSREFYIIIRLRSEKETDVFPYLSRIEQSINDNGFTTRRATEQDLKRMLGVYFEQNVTTEKFEDYDGDQLLSIFHDYKQAAGCIKQVRIDIEELADFDCLLPDWYIHMLYLKALIHPDAHLPQGTIDTTG